MLKTFFTVNDLERMCSVNVNVRGSWKRFFLIKEICSLPTWHKNLTSFTVHHSLSLWFIFGSIVD
jgi:hypothetical protein